MRVAPRVNPSQRIGFYESVVMVSRVPSDQASGRLFRKPEGLRKFDSRHMVVETCT
jgi:hypothetical protein